MTLSEIAIVKFMCNNMLLVQNELKLNIMLLMQFHEMVDQTNYRSESVGTQPSGKLAVLHDLIGGACIIDCRSELNEHNII